MVLVFPLVLVFSFGFGFSFGFPHSAHGREEAQYNVGWLFATGWLAVMGSIFIYSIWANDMTF